MGACKSISSGIQVLVLGTKGSGKSFMIQQLIKESHAEFTDTTVAYSFNEYTQFNEVLHIWDLGSSETIHDLWPSFYRDIFCNEVLYVLNPESDDHVEQARSDLLFLSSEEELKHSHFTIILIFPSDKVPDNYDEEAFKLKLDPENLYLTNINAKIETLFFHSITTRSENQIRRQKIREIFSRIADKHPTKAQKNKDDKKDKKDKKEKKDKKDAKTKETKDVDSD